MNKNKDNIRNIVLSRIKSGEVVMRPRWHFVLKGILAIVGIGILALSLIYLLSFVVFILRQTGVMFVPIFGMRGLIVFAFSSPWLLILLSVIFIFVLEVLVRRYSFSYRKPLLYTMLSIVFVATIGTYLISQTSVHQRLLQHAEKGGLPVIGSMYRNYGLHTFDNVHVGVIIEITGTGFSMTDRVGDTVEVLIGSDTRFPLGTNFAIDDRVVVLGERNGGSIEAIGLRGINGDRMQRPSRRGWHPLFPPRPR